jgi:hypothetical protein
VIENDQQENPQASMLNDLLLPEPASWRELLRTIISSPAEKQRIAQETGINETTLRRWAMNETTPRRSYALRPLLLALPQYAELLTRLIRYEFEDFAPSERPSFAMPAPPHAEPYMTYVQPEFYDSVLRALIRTPARLRFWTICKMVLQELLDQLDPKTMKRGMSVSVARVLVPLDLTKQRVYCLREAIAVGTAPWGSAMTQPALFLGSESLAGYAVISGTPAFSQNVPEESMVPIRRELYEESAAAFPLLRAPDGVAGCLLIASTQVAFFTQERLALIERYANLITLAFAGHEYIGRDTLNLRPMASTEQQLALFSTFNQRILDVRRSATSEGQQLSRQEAEQMVWLQLADELVVH